MSFGRCPFCGRTVRRGVTTSKTCMFRCLPAHGLFLWLFGWLVARIVSSCVYFAVASLGPQVGARRLRGFLSLRMRLIFSGRKAGRTEAAEN